MENERFISIFFIVFMYIARKKMKSQIFKAPVKIELLFDLLDKVCIKTKDYYFMNNEGYRKMIYHNYHVEFLDALKPSYHASKLFYIERDLTYNSFVNIIRQICKVNKIAYSSNIKYNDSVYKINYYIYHNK